MAKEDKNNLASKVKRTFTSFLPVDKTRNGACLECGECCKLPTPCYFLKYDSNNKSYCDIYLIRPPQCRVYPRTREEQITKRTCGYRFK